MLISSKVEAFCTSKDRKDKVLAVKYNNFKDIMSRINFESMCKNLIPYFLKAREYFKGLKLLN
jgi:hypothetical protein